MSALFALSDGRVRVTWSGPGHEPASGGVLRADRGVIATVEGKAIGLPYGLAVPEQSGHTLTLESLDGRPVDIHHRDPLVLRDVARAPDGRFLSVRINFDGQVGQSRFEVFSEGALAFSFEVAVRPVKLDWEHDYAVMLRDVDETVSGLAGEYLRATSQGANVAPRAPDVGGWLGLVTRAVSELERALAFVAAHPRGATSLEFEWTRAGAIRRISSPLRRAMRVGAGRGAIGGTGSLPVRERLEAGVVRPTMDTPEHRWLAARLRGVLRDLDVLHRTERSLPISLRRARVLEEVGHVREHLVKWLRRRPLVEAAEAEQPGTPSLQLVRAPGYAEAYAALQRLRFGLRFEAGPLQAAAKELHLLYEIWCYLTLAQAVAERLAEPVPTSVFRTEARGVRLLLGRGRRHALRFRGGAVRLLYNPRFGAGLAPQRPDFVIEIDGASGVRRYVLDAKYRRDDSARYARRYGVPGPPEDALGDLHRYRDAIVAGGRRSVVEAVALYPWRVPEPGAFERSRLWASVGEIGVGAMPVLPGQTAWLRAWLARVLPR